MALAVVMGPRLLPPPPRLVRPHPRRDQLSRLLPQMFPQTALAVMTAAMFVPALTLVTAAPSMDTGRFSAPITSALGFFFSSLLISYSVVPRQTTVRPTVILRLERVMLSR